MILSSTGGSCKEGDKWKERLQAEITVLEEQGGHEGTRPTFTTVRFLLFFLRALADPPLRLAEDAVDQINARAVQVVERVQQKLTGA
jgi:hypothetical protein